MKEMSASPFLSASTAAAWSMVTKPSTSSPVSFESHSVIVAMSPSSFSGILLRG